MLSNLYEQIAAQVPPVGFEVGDENISCYSVDFRHILYTGWIAAENISEEHFYDHNRLCEHAIMQQSGIDLFING